MSSSLRTIVINTAPNKSNILELPQSAMSTSVMDTLYEESEGGGPKKRRRLTHLTPDEKMMRRKLKNRVAAQTARDRKKDLMSVLESQLAKIMEENKKLQKENVELRNKSGVLIQENTILKERLETGSPSKPESEYPGSAVLFAPLPQEQTRTQSHWTMPLATSYLTVSLCLALCSRMTRSQRKEVSLSMHHQPSPSSKPSKHLKLAQWWGPQQQSWNPSMNL
ncbi:X-box-binding protein 1-like [Mizuhopecten yessoensis]|uniref:X-box-binding protein 1 n=1 Tax=Mizuhopecten yessoensis TaxID=6573 RepID=A0A5S9GRC3_MIZYE|nr:X-box-binding protein 1-like [Mizuhopecten yessoensis]AXM05360.1 X box binding protein 1 [Mizuhopecten yessoensis]